MQPRRGSEKRVFDDIAKALDHRSIYVFGPDEHTPLSRGNRVYHPKRIGTSKDPGPLERAYAASWPFDDGQMLALYWCKGEPLAKRVLAELQAMFKQYSDVHLHGGWYSITMDELELLIRLAAETVNVELWEIAHRERVIWKEVEKRHGR